VRSGPPAANIAIRLLGELDVRVGGRSVQLGSARAESLLGFLLVHRDAPQARRRVAFLLWPDSTESQARTNLRHVLHTLRGALPHAERWLEVTPRTLRWRPDAPYRLDVAAFDAAVARAGTETDDDAVAALTEAVDAYRGDLLEGCYDDWVLEERARLHERFVDALARLCAALEGDGELDSVREPALRAAARIAAAGSWEECMAAFLAHLDQVVPPRRGDGAGA
jgi:DNA-binding SARP family transcriptional activator